MWGAANAQELSCVSPRMYEEFALEYHRPILDRFGLNCYACCESLDNKLDLVLKHIPRLRRVSVSPWTDTRLAAEKLQDKYIYSWKPNPVIALTQDDNAILSQIERAMDDARGCRLEMILKDTHTINNDPSALIQWTRTASERASEGYR